MNVEERKKIEQNLLHGDKQKISSESGYSRMAVYRWFNTSIPNKLIEAVATRISNEREQQFIQASKGQQA